MKTPIEATYEELARAEKAARWSGAAYLPEEQHSAGMDFLWGMVVGVGGVILWLLV